MVSCSWLFGYLFCHFWWASVRIKFWATIYFWQLRQLPGEIFLSVSVVLSPIFRPDVISANVYLSYNRFFPDFFFSLGRTRTTSPFHNDGNSLAPLLLKCISFPFLWWSCSLALSAYCGLSISSETGNKVLVLPHSPPPQIICTAEYPISWLDVFLRSYNARYGSFPIKNILVFKGVL